MSVVCRKSASDCGLRDRPYGEQSASVQKVGMMISLAPEAMSSRKASGKAMSQHMRRPMGPRGVENVMWGCEEEEVRWGRSGCLWKGEGGD